MRRTGKVKLLLVEGENKPTIQEVFRDHVQEGCEVWTDGGSAFLWLDAPDSGYRHESVIHKNREFSKYLPPDQEGEEAKLVSTNAAEGLFGRVKRWFAKRDVKGLSREAYGPWLAEWLWRHQFLGPDALGAEREPYRQQFWQTVRFLANQNKPVVDEFTEITWDAEKAFPEVAQYINFVRSRDKDPVDRRAHVKKAAQAALVDEENEDAEPDVILEEEDDGPADGRPRFRSLRRRPEVREAVDLDDDEKADVDEEEEFLDPEIPGEWLNGFPDSLQMLRTPPEGPTPTESPVAQQEEDVGEGQLDEPPNLRPQDRLLGEGWETRMEAVPGRTRKRQAPLARVVGVPLRRGKKPRVAPDEQEPPQPALVEEVPAVPVRRSQRLQEARDAAPALD